SVAPSPREPSHAGWPGQSSAVVRVATGDKRRCRPVQQRRLVTRFPEPACDFVRENKAGIESVPGIMSDGKSAIHGLWKETCFMAIKTIRLSRLETDLKNTLNECARS